MRRVLLLLQITLYPHIATFRTNSVLVIINITNQTCRYYLLLYIPWTVYERWCSTLLHDISAPYISPTYFIIIESVSQLSEPPVLVLPLRCSSRYDLRSHKWDGQISGRDSASTWTMGYGEIQLLFPYTRRNCPLCPGRVEVVQHVRTRWVKLCFVEGITMKMQNIWIPKNK